MTFGGYSMHHSGLGLGSVYLFGQHNVSPTQVTNHNHALGWTPCAQLLEEQQSELLLSVCRIPL